MSLDQLPLLTCTLSLSYFISEQIKKGSSINRDQSPIPSTQTITPNLTSSLSPSPNLQNNENFNGNPELRRKPEIPKQQEKQENNEILVKQEMPYDMPNQRIKIEKQLTKFIHTNENSFTAKKQIESFEKKQPVLEKNSNNLPKTRNQEKPTTTDSLKESTRSDFKNKAKETTRSFKSSKEETISNKNKRVQTELTENEENYVRTTNFT